MIIKVLLSINDWLYGCVSIERVVTVAKGVTFNKLKSKQMAKWVTPAVILSTILSHLHDPFHRHFIDDIDIDEQRTWCLVQYSFSLNIFSSVMAISHVLIPFAINLFSTIFIFISISRSTLQPRLTYKEHLRLQLKLHKHLLIASCALMLLL